MTKHRFPVIIATAATFLLVGGITHSADACGLMGCIINQVAPGQGDKLDNFNRYNGHPAEELGHIGLDYRGPGASQAPRIHQHQFDNPNQEN
jgi:hypothetical protein